MEETLECALEEIKPSSEQHLGGAQGMVGMEVPGWTHGLNQGQGSDLGVSEEEDIASLGRGLLGCQAGWGTRTWGRL